MKNRFSSFDLTAIVTDLKKLIGLRCSNIYDINTKTYLLKLFGLEKQVFLMIESGIRIHTTNFKRDKAQIPSVFCFKLRKHIRTKRLSDVRQLGIDRVIDFVFGTGKSEQHLLVELYANGNILLTDAEYKILTLLRTYKVDDNFVATNRIYPVDTAKEMSIPDFQLAKDALNNCDDKDTLKKVMVSIIVLSSEIVEHCILKSGLKPGRKPKAQPLTDEEVEKVITSFKEGIQIMKDAAEKGCKGYITVKVMDVQEKTSKKKKKTREEQTNEEEANILKQIQSHHSSSSGNSGESNLIENNTNNSNEIKEVKGEEEEVVGEKPKMYEQFLPYVFEQFKNKEMVEYESFMQACDFFFTEIENQKQQQQSIERDKKINSKVEKVKKAHTVKVNALQNKSTLNIMKAELIEYNVDDVEKAILIIKSGVDNKLDWNELKRLLKESKKEGNYIASLIHSLNFEKNTMNLLLAPKLYEFNEENEENDEKNEKILSQPPIQVEIDFLISAHLNAQKYYHLSKLANTKKEKTLNMAGVAIKQAEKTAERTSKEIKVGKEIKELRKTFWFEKFNWFITTENYLVIAGRDAQQNELIVKRYMEKNDVYVHAEVHGAASCVIKNYTGNAISPISLEQAGYFCVCRSKAWQSKTIASAYWVYPDQVSKTAQTGEYLSTGSFMIRGKKNFLEPTNLVMGLGIFFYLDDESWSNNHRGERSVKLLIDDSFSPSSFPSSSPFSPEVTEGEETPTEQPSIIENNVVPQNNIGTTEINNDKNNDKNNNKKIDKTDKNNKNNKNKNNNKKDKNNNKKDKNNKNNKNEKNNKKQVKMVEKEENLQQDDEDKKEEEEEEEKEEEEEVNKSSQLDHKLMSSYTLTLGGDDENNEEGEGEGGEGEGEEKGGKHKAAKKKLSRAQRKQLKNTQKNPQYDPLLEKIKNQPKDKKTTEDKVPRRSKKKKGNQNRLDEEDYQDQLLAKKVLGIKVDENLPLPNDDEEEEEENGDVVEEGEENVGEGEEGNEEGVEGEEDVGEGERGVEEGEGDEGKEDIQEEGGEEEGGVEGGKKKEVPNFERRERREKEKKELALISEQEKINIVSDVIKSQSEQIDKLTGMPKKEDVLLFAIPMCAPYHALQNFKYKVKLTPGKTTRGTARKNATNYFLKLDTATDRERDLIKHLNEGQVTSAILGDVTVSFPSVVTNNKKKSSNPKKKNKNKNK